MFQEKAYQRSSITNINELLDDHKSSKKNSKNSNTIILNQNFITTFNNTAINSKYYD